MGIGNSIVATNKVIFGLPLKIFVWSLFGINMLYCSASTKVQIYRHHTARIIVRELIFLVVSNLGKWQKSDIVCP